MASGENHDISSSPVVLETTAMMVESRSQYPLKDIIEPTANDVMYGRGGGTNHHPGNKKYRQIVSERTEEYINAPRVKKAVIAMSIVQKWRNSQSPPGRFLKMDGPTGTYCDVGDRKARSKTSQALRENAPGTLKAGSKQPQDKKAAVTGSSDNDESVESDEMKAKAKSKPIKKQRQQMKTKTKKPQQRQRRTKKVDAQDDDDDENIIRCTFEIPEPPASKMRSTLTTNPTKDDAAYLDDTDLNFEESPGIDNHHHDDFALDGNFLDEDATDYDCNIHNRDNKSSCYNVTTMTTNVASKEFHPTSNRHEERSEATPNMPVSSECNGSTDGICDGALSKRETSHTLHTMECCRKKRMNNREGSTIARSLKETQQRVDALIQQAIVSADGTTTCSSTNFVNRRTTGVTPSNPCSTTAPTASILKETNSATNDTEPLVMPLDWSTIGDRIPTIGDIEYHDTATVSRNDVLDYNYSTGSYDNDMTTTAASSSVHNANNNPAAGIRMMKTSKSTTDMCAKEACDEVVVHMDKNDEFIYANVSTDIDRELMGIGHRISTMELMDFVQRDENV